MFGISFGKLIVLVAVIAAVWYGFKYVGRLQNIEKGQRKSGEPTLSERMRRAAGKRTGHRDPEVIEDTQECPVCKTFVSVGSVSHCGKSNCPH
ncbi:hypothetical protein [Aestuariispira insulae]|uniref:Uncharacterized protein n=1 Tax=Aestuariispira insulae TaxID=1461337 RepID=A0A3D9HW06_9PROT|nr:hypothetical protein [Aestuariispira insulae]RED53693.1 uncharacterized protein DFP90_101486 [Aestuariispira insulae]